MKRGDFTVIVASSGGPARKYSIPRRLTLIIGSLFSILALTTCLSGLHYFSMWNRSGEFDSLRVEVDGLRRGNEAYRVDAGRLGDQVAFLETTAKKLEMMAGVSHEGTGVGGPTNAVSLDLDGLTDLRQTFQALERRSISLQSEFNKLQDYYTSRQILLAASPSIMPVEGYPSDGFGWRKDPFSGLRDFHYGVDISAPHGARVIATADGTVSRAGWDSSGYGRLVVVKHRFGLSTRYGHLSKIAVEAGHKVRRGDVIGYVGSTGRATANHVHFEVRLGKEALDPMRFFRE